MAVRPPAMEDAELLSLLKKNKSRYWESWMRRAGPENFVGRRWAMQQIAAELQVRETIGREDLERILAEAEAHAKPVVA